MERRRIIDGLAIAATGIALMGWSQNIETDTHTAPVTDSPPPAVLITPDIPLPYQWIIPPGWKFDVGSPIGRFTQGYEVPKEEKMCFEWPVSGPISTYFDYQFINNSQYYALYGLNPLGHFAIDIDQKGNLGGSVLSPADGIVIDAIEEDWGLGHHIIIDFGNEWKGVFGHNDELMVEKGQLVHRGEIIATVGSTGYSTGPHVHFELSHNDLLVDPLLFLESGNLEC